MSSRPANAIPCLTPLSYALKRGSQHLADVVLLVKSENVTFPCHGLVLEARSPRFQQLLFAARGQHRHAAECFLTRCKYILELDHPFPVEASAFSSFLELLYDGRVGRNQPKDSSTVSALCEFYRISLASSITINEPVITSYAVKQTELEGNGVVSAAEENASESNDSVSGVTPRSSSKEKYQRSDNAGFCYPVKPKSGRNDRFDDDVGYAEKILRNRERFPRSSTQCNDTSLATIESGADNDDSDINPEKCADEQPANVNLFQTPGHPTRLPLSPLRAPVRSLETPVSSLQAPVTDSSSKETGFAETAEASRGSRRPSPKKPKQTPSPNNSRNKRNTPASRLLNRRTRSRSSTPLPPQKFQDSSFELRADSAQDGGVASVSAGPVNGASASTPPLKSTLLDSFLPERKKDLTSEDYITSSTQSIDSDGDPLTRCKDLVEGSIVMEVIHPKKITEYELHNKLGRILGAANRTGRKVFPGVEFNNNDPPLLVELSIVEARVISSSHLEYKDFLELRPINYHREWGVHFVWKKGAGGGDNPADVEEFFQSKEGFMVWERTFQGSQYEVEMPRIPGTAFFYTKRDLSRFLDEIVDEDPEFIHCKFTGTNENGFFRRYFRLVKSQLLPNSLLLRQLKTVLSNRFSNSVFHVYVDRRAQNRGYVVFDCQKFANEFDRRGKIGLEIGGVKIFLNPADKTIMFNGLIRVELSDIPDRIYNDGLVGRLKFAMSGIGRQSGAFKFLGDKGIAFFRDDDNFTPNHKIFSDGFVEVRGKNSIERVTVRLKETSSGSESSFSVSS